METIFSSFKVRYLFIFLFILISISGVWGVGRTDVLDDIANLSELYYNNRCNDTTNISYGSLDGCHLNSSQNNFALNYNIGLALMGMYGNLNDNMTLINATIDGLMFMAKIQNFEGDWANDENKILQNYQATSVQFYIIISSLADAYLRVQSNLTEVQKVTLKNMFSRATNFMNTYKTTIKFDSGVYGSVDRLSDYSFRKMLNFSVDVINKSDDFRIEMKIFPDGAFIAKNISIYLGNDNSTNYTVDLTFYNPYLTGTAYGIVEIPVNKTALFNSCVIIGSEYYCNITTAWKNPSGWKTTRTTNPSSGLINRTWTTSNNNGTWIPYANNEEWIRLNYYDNTTLSYLGVHYCVANQMSAKAYASYMVNLVLDDNYTFTKNMNERLYDNLTNYIINHQTDGVYLEWNEFYRRRVPDYCTNYSSHGGYSVGYQYLTDFFMARLYNLTGSLSLLSSLNNSINNLSYFYYLDKTNVLTMAGGFGTRSGNLLGYSNVLNYQTTDNATAEEGWTMFKNIATYSILDGISEQVNAYNYFVKNYLSYRPDVNYSGIVRYAGDMYTIIYLYENFPTSTNTTSIITNQDYYFKNLNNNGLVSLATPNYRTFLSYYNNSPSGVIGQVYNRNNDLNLFSAFSDRGSITYGLGSLNKGDCSNSTYTPIHVCNSSSFDIRTNMSSYNNYPYSINFSGNLTPYNTSVISNINYNTSYTFYDNYIKIIQRTSSPVELQFYPITNFILENGTILNGSMIKKDNSTIFPINFDVTYTTTSSNVTWGRVDKLNSSGTYFYYLININADYNFFENYTFTLYNDDNKSWYLKPNFDNSVLNVHNKLIVNNISNQQINFTLNISESMLSFNKTKFNTTKSWTNALFFYPNKSVNTNLRTITSNDGYFNVNTLIDSANNMSYALDNYILEETPKTNEPFQLIKTATSTLITYKIRSNLTNNVTVPINLSGISTCIGLTSLKITPKGGTELSYTDSASMTRICNELKSGIYNITLTQSNDSNTIILDYTLTPGGSGGGGGSGVVIKDNCMMIYDFILKYYNSSSRKLEFTNNEFDNLKSSTLLTTNELNNYLNYYPILCANYSTLPFIDYSPLNIPKELINTSPNIEDVKQFRDDVVEFTNRLLSDPKTFLMFLIAIILFVLLAIQLNNGNRKSR